MQSSDRKNVRPPDAEKLGLKQGSKTAIVGNHVRVYGNDRWEKVVKVTRKGGDFWHKEIAQVEHAELGEVTEGKKSDAKEGKAGSGGVDDPDMHPYPWFGRADQDQGRNYANKHQKISWLHASSPGGGDSWLLAP